MYVLVAFLFVFCCHFWRPSGIFYYYIFCVVEYYSAYYTISPSAEGWATVDVDGYVFSILSICQKRKKWKKREKSPHINSILSMMTMSRRTPHTHTHVDSISESHNHSCVVCKCVENYFIVKMGNNTVAMCGNGNSYKIFLSARSSATLFCCSQRIDRFAVS